MPNTFNSFVFAVCFFVIYFSCEKLLVLYFANYFGKLVRKLRVLFYGQTAKPATRYEVPKPQVTEDFNNRISQAFKNIK